MFGVILQARNQGGGVGRPPQLPIPKILFHPLAWGPIKVTIPSSYRWKYGPLWRINHPRRLELDSLFLPWYRQPNHTLYIVFQWRIQGGGDRDDHPPPLELVPILKTYAKCAWPGPITPRPPWNVADVTRAMSKGGGCLWMSKSGGVFQFFEGGWRHADNVQGWVGACECPRVGVFFNFPEGGWRHADNVQGGCVCLWMSSPPPLCSTHPSSDPPPPTHTHTHLDGWLRACIGLINSTPASRAHAICLGESTKVNLNTGSGAREP